MQFAFQIHKPKPLTSLEYIYTILILGKDQTSTYKVGNCVTFCWVLIYNPAIILFLFWNDFDKAGSKTWKVLHESYVAGLVVFYKSSEIFLLSNYCSVV